tara:strand:+ start:425 stop:1108 length:684 start_codon:yes stop_codon:yes gene_type:complete
MLAKNKKIIKHKVPKNIILYGGSGQSLQVKPIIDAYGSNVIAIIDDTPGLKSPFKEIPIFEGYRNFYDNFDTRQCDKTGFCITIGNPHGDVRIKLHDLLSNDGFIPISFSHQTAWIDDDAQIGIGAQILERAIISARVKIGKQCIVNTNSSIGHECIIYDGVEIGPSATVCGIVEIGFNTWIGAGATILPRIKIGENCMIGAGAVVMKNVPDGTTVIGNPSRPILQK